VQTAAIPADILQNTPTFFYKEFYILVICTLRVDSTEAVDMQTRGLIDCKKETGIFSMAKETYMKWFQRQVISRFNRHSTL